MEEKKKKSGFATAGLVLGIIGLCTSFIPIINNASFILALIGAIFSIVSLIKKSSKKMAIIGLIICILSTIIVYQSQDALSDSIDNAVNSLNNEMDNMSGDNTQDILEKHVDVTIGEFEVSESDFITNTKLPVKVTNKSSEKKSFSIELEAINSDGSRITTDSVYANDLNAGQSQEFDTFTLVTSDKIETMKNATFKIVKVSMY